MEAKMPEEEARNQARLNWQEMTFLFWTDTDCCQKNKASRCRNYFVISLHSLCRPIPQLQVIPNIPRRTRRPFLTVRRLHLAGVGVFEPFALGNRENESTWVGGYVTVENT
jgi:hypothetical protein